jgi:hypothetical protein
MKIIYAVIFAFFQSMTFEIFEKNQAKPMKPNNIWLDSFAI